MDASRRQTYLGAMGIQVWVRRDRMPATSEIDGEPVVATEALPDDVPQQPPVKPTTGGFPADMLRAALRGDAPAPPPRVAEPAKPQPAAEAPVAAKTGLDVSGLDWSGLATQVSGCRACALHQSRHQIVFGSGNQTASLMIVGEAPGADEDREGAPFVGSAGQLLDAMLLAIGMTRDQVYVTNVVKCRPPGNRGPEPEEAAACMAYLGRQIALLQPQLILSVGAISAHMLLGTDLPVGKLRGRVHQHASGVPVAVTYHPAYLLRRPEEKAKVWQDLQRVVRALSS